jgi:glutaredoxin 3
MQLIDASEVHTYQGGRTELHSGMASVKIYTRAWCGYCTRAVRLLRDKGVHFEEIDATGNRELRRWLAEASGQSTVPQIFIDEQPIGGCDELYELERAGALDTLLATSSSST